MSIVRWMIVYDFKCPLRSIKFREKSIAFRRSVNVSDEHGIYYFSIECHCVNLASSYDECFCFTRFLS